MLCLFFRGHIHLSHATGIIWLRICIVVYGQVDSNKLGQLACCSLDIMFVVPAGMLFGVS